MKKNNILLFIKYPPPITGATLMNKRVFESTVLNDQFDLRAILISYKNNLVAQRNLTIKKIFLVTQVWRKLGKELIFHRPSFIYFQISPLGVAFIRDLCFVVFIKLLRIKIVYHLRGKGIKEQTENKLKKRLYKYAFQGSDIICLSQLLTFDISSVHRGKVHIVNNGIPCIDSQLLKIIKEDRTFPIRLLFLSNLIISKGILDFVEALKILKNEGFDFEAIIAGAEGTLSSKELKKMITDSKLSEQVKYVGPKYDNDKFSLLQTCDVLVFPTKNDIWGNVILEAMQVGLPVVATIEGAIPEIIDDGITGFLVEKNNPYQLAEKLILFFNNPSLIHKMGKKGKEKFQMKYTLGSFENNMGTVFNNVLKNKD